MIDLKKCSFTVCLVLVIFCMSALAQEKPAPEKGFVSIFNGADLTGWDGDPRLWSVEMAFFEAKPLRKTQPKETASAYGAAAKPPTSSSKQSSSSTAETPASSTEAPNPKNGASKATRPISSTGPASQDSYTRKAAGDGS